jgi:hypothetical protein
MEIVENNISHKLQLRLQMFWPILHLSLFLHTYQRLHNFLPLDAGFFFY